MSSTLVQPDCSAEKTRPTVVALSLPPLEKALIPVCAELAIAQAYFAALRQPGDAQPPRLLLAISGAEIAKQRRLAAAVAEMLPDDVELDLIELAEDEFSESLRKACTPFYSR
ncbi:enhanced serine sensitivity protein SseB C-terminal domain-containing protein [Pseudomonas sp. RL_15y_Pfl2_60]|uniref:enhanced serine sensitivity protein SseB C-terminal domain-containing protein n=1 Tax=Pseudomonas sp. RL_15y_Pfl2_60 TaxID=3088709 RepID=UPI0030D6D04C